MLENEEWFMIRDLHAQGFSIRAISKKTGFDRRTISEYLNNTSLPESKKRAPSAYQSNIVRAQPIAAELQGITIKITRDNT